MNTPTKLEQEQHRREFVAGLRSLANFLEVQPNVPCPYRVGMNSFVDTRDELATAARGGTWEKGANDNWFWLRRTFGQYVILEVNTGRENVCRRVVVGQKTLPAVPEQVVDVVEWICDEPVLAEEERNAR